MNGEHTVRCYGRPMGAPTTERMQSETPKPLLLLINSTNVMYFLHIPIILKIENYNFT